jgi:predicted metal-binding membrane protein
MGLEHGRVCLGCCWVIMLLLFVGGVMNLLWVAALTALVLVEKVAPAGRRIGRAGGVILIGAGLVALVAG